MRRHVFPVCTPGSKTFVPKPKLEGGKVGTIGTVRYTETEDPDFIFGDRTGAFEGNHLAGLANIKLKEKGQILIDLALPPQTDQIVIENEEEFYFQFPFQWGSLSSTHPKSAATDVQLWEEINEQLWFESIPDPGTTFCVGIKKTASSIWSILPISMFVAGSNYLSQSPRDIKHPFIDSEFTSSNDTVPLSTGVWITAMWTGTRFVILGSNNWY